MDQPDLAPRPTRRSFTADYKARIVAEYDKLPHGSPARGALLRGEGLYTSHICEWRRQRDAPPWAGLSPKPRPPKRTAEQVELGKLRSRNAKLEEELNKTKLALQITGKLRGRGVRGGGAAGGPVRRISPRVLWSWWVGHSQSRSGVRVLWVWVQSRV